MDREMAGNLIDYIEALCERTNHQHMMEHLNREIGLSEEDLDIACRELGKIAGRDFSIT